MILNFRHDILCLDITPVSFPLPVSCGTFQCIALSHHVLPVTIIFPVTLAEKKSKKRDTTCSLGDWHVRAGDTIPFLGLPWYHLP